MTRCCLGSQRADGGVGIDRRLPAKDDQGGSARLPRRPPQSQSSFSGRTRPSVPAEDPHQRLYGPRTVLGHYRIRIAGRSWQITLNYRATLRYAMTMLEGGDYTDLEDAANRPATARRDPTPPRWCRWPGRLVPTRRGGDAVAVMDSRRPRCRQHCRHGAGPLPT